MRGMRQAAILVAMATVATTGMARAEVSEVNVSLQYGLTYLPMMVMEDQKLLEKHADKAGVPVKVGYAKLGGPGLVNDSLLSGSAQFGAVGVPALVQLWARTKGNLNIKAVGANSSMPMYLNTSNPDVKSIKDFTEKDKIALPTIKVSVQAVTLQMAVAKLYGFENYAQLDRFTVSMSHPDGMAAMMSGKSEIDGHFTSPPFQYTELQNKAIHTVLNSYDVLGGQSTFTLMVAPDQFREKNPKVFGAFVDGFKEATAWINQDKKRAADFYLKAANSKEDPAEVLGQLNDPLIEFTLTPKNIQAYSDFMFKVGQVKVKADSWKDMVFPHLHDLSGS